MVTSALAVASFVYGLSMPLMSLVLTGQGVGSTMIGLSAAAQALSIFIVAPFVSRLINACGAARAMFYAIISTSVVFLLLAAFPNVYAWFPLRIALGISTSIIWIGGEAWVNYSVDESRRGRVIGLYTMALAAGFALGPFVLSITGAESWTPFVVSAFVTALGALPLLPALDAGPKLEGEPSVRLSRYIVLAPLVMLTYFVFAATDSALLTFLSPYAIHAGLAENEAVNLLTMLAVGGMVFIVPIGWLADHVDRALLIFAALLGMLIGSILLPSLVTVSFWNQCLFFLMGACFAVLYTVPLVLLGQQFRGADLAAASTVYSIMFSMGSVVGPIMGGVAIDWFGQDGMPRALALMFILLLPLPLIKFRSKNRRNPQ